MPGTRQTIRSAHPAGCKTLSIMSMVRMPSASERDRSLWHVAATSSTVRLPQNGVQRGHRFLGKINRDIAAPLKAASG